MSAFADELRAAREERMMTQAEVARLVGRDPNTIARWERGERTPDDLAEAEILRRLRAARARIDRHWVVLHKIPHPRTGKPVVVRATHIGFRTRQAARDYQAAHSAWHPGAWVSQNPKKRTHRG